MIIDHRQRNFCPRSANKFNLPCSCFLDEDDQGQKDIQAMLMTLTATSTANSAQQQPMQ